MINEKQMFEALVNIVSNKNIERLLKSLIFVNDENEYLLFGTYVIKKRDNRYVVSILNSDEINTFSNLKTAVTWTTMEHRNLVLDAKRVDYLDKTIEGYDFNIELHKTLYKRTKDSELKVIYLNKLQTDQNKKKLLTNELDGHIKKIQSWQLKKFQEQTIK